MTESGRESEDVCTLPCLALPSGCSCESRDHFAVFFANSRLESRTRKLETIGTRTVLVSRD